MVNGARGTEGTGGRFGCGASGALPIGKHRLHGQASPVLASRGRGGGRAERRDGRGARASGSLAGARGRRRRHGRIREVSGSRGGGRGLQGAEVIAAAGAGRRRRQEGARQEARRHPRPQPHQEPTIESTHPDATPRVSPPHAGCGEDPGRRAFLRLPPSYPRRGRSARARDGIFPLPRTQLRQCTTSAERHAVLDPLGRTGENGQGCLADDIEQRDNRRNPERGADTSGGRSANPFCPAERTPPARMAALG
jgi:hypothetical protein